MLKFTVTIYGDSEHAERNAAQVLWAALEMAKTSLVAVLVSEAEIDPLEPIELRTAAEIESERLTGKLSERRRRQLQRIASSHTGSA